MTYGYEGDYAYSYKTEYTYDANGSVLTEIETYTDTGGAVTVYPVVSYSYTADGKKLSKSNYDENGNGYKYEYTYNENGDVLSHTYENVSGDYSFFYKTDYAYDAAGNCISETETYSDGDSYTTYYTYDAAGNRIASDYENENYKSHSEFTYDAKGNPLTETYNYSNTYNGETTDYTTVYTYEYDASGNCVSEKYVSDDFSCEYVKSYFDNGELRSSVGTFSDGSYSSTVYNSDGQMLEDVYEAPDYSQKTYYSYDALGNLLSVCSNISDMEIFTVRSYDYVSGTYTERSNEMTGYGWEEETDW